MCWDGADDAGPRAATSIRFAPTPSPYVASKTTGFIASKGGFDPSTLFCIPPP